ncbi:hypothetical protein A5680_11080 [Mycobacterium sp. E2989]|nr:hypothetical protein A5680_11080 [Mycobacterium sp. E2989]
MLLQFDADGVAKDLIDPRRSAGLRRCANDPREGGKYVAPPIGVYTDMVGTVKVSVVIVGIHQDAVFAASVEVVFTRCAPQ